MARKIAAIFVLMLLISLMTAYSSAVHDGVEWVELPKNHPLKKAEMLKSRPALQELFLFPHESYSSDEAESIIGRVGSLPDRLLDELVHKQVKIRLFTGNLTDLDGAIELKGIKPRGYKDEGAVWDKVPGMGGSRTVYVKIGASERGEGHNSVNLEFHELSHTIDAILFQHISSSREFRALHKKEGRGLFPGSSYLNNYPEEYFAEAAALYFMKGAEREQLKSAAPDTFLLLSQLLK